MLFTLLREKNITHGRVAEGGKGRGEHETGSPGTVCTTTSNLCTYTAGGTLKLSVISIRPGGATPVPNPACADDAALNIIEQRPSVLASYQRPM